MRAAQIYDEDDIPGPARETELNLGLGSLLGIFFGIALVCGLFFGFGYNIGHRSPGPYVSSEPLYEAPRATAPAIAPKPSAQTPDYPGNAQPDAAARVIVPTAAASASPAPQPLSTVRSAPQPAATANRSPNEAAPAIPSPSIMVQIAAVRSRSDAEALAAALHKNGFDPTVRSEPQDKLLHVQIGPFNSRDEARNMRQKLSGAGYNAFIK